MTSPITVTAFYHFFRIAEEDLQSVQTDLLQTTDSLGIRGLILIAPEGINGTVAGTPEAIEQLKDHLREMQPSIEFKDSPADEIPFKRNFVKIREEIVHIGDPGLFPEGENNHLTPDEWNEILANEDVALIDVRNTYETSIGKFKGAIDPETKTFTEFPDFVKNCDIPKDKKVLMYCTGGIRCEKASLEMQRQGFQHVYQLKGGILQYIKEHPNEQFEGECFIFDHRAAVDQELAPSARYRQCPHCGDPGDVQLSCAHCEKSGIICQSCSQQDDRRTCSKDCAYRVRCRQVRT